MLRIFAASLAVILLSTPSLGADVSYRKDILPLWKAQCAACHGAQSPYLGDFLENKKRYKQEMKGPRMDTYADLIFFVGWPDTGRWIEYHRPQTWQYVPISRCQR